ANKNQRDGRKVHKLTAGILTGCVTSGYVSDLMRHHSGKLSFVIGCQDQTCIDEEEATGQSKSIDVLGIDNFDGEWHLGIGVPHQILSKPVDVLGDDRICDELARGFNLLGIVSAHRDLAFDAVPVAQPASATYFAATDRIEIADAAVMISLHRISRRGD